MQFVIVHRGPKGERIETEVTAEDRAAVFKQAESRGIKSVIEVRPGKATSPSKPMSPSLIRGLLAGVIVVALAAVVWLFFFNREEVAREESVSNSKLIKDVVPVACKTASVVQQETNVAPVSAEIYDKGLGDDWETIQRVKTEGGQYVDAQGKRHRVKVAKTLFDYNTDSILCAVLCAGTQEIVLPPFDGNEDEEFLESLKTPIVIMSDDPDDVKEKKLLVRAARKEVKDMMDQGHSFQSVIQSHRADMDLRRESVSQAVEGLREYLDKDDEEGAELYIETMNPVLEKIGATPLHMPAGENRPHLKRKEN